MSETKLTIELKGIIDKKFSNNEIAEKFLERIEEGKLTKDENPKSHFCTYFAANDPKAKQVFIGHHIKSGLWLFNGGHIDEGETINKTLAREINEEWGLDSRDFNIEPTSLLTITDIYNPAKQTCRAHYDLWHFVGVDKNEFKPDAKKQAEEFYRTDWKSLNEARNLIIDKNTLLAVDFIENNYFDK